MLKLKKYMKVMSSMIGFMVLLLQDVLQAGEEGCIRGCRNRIIAANGAVRCSKMGFVRVSPELGLIFDPMKGVVSEQRADVVLYTFDPVFERIDKLDKTADDLMTMSDHDLVRELQQLIFGYTVYALYENPDWGRPGPASLPLLAFDRQPVNQPLELS